MILTSQLISHDNIFFSMANIYNVDEHVKIVSQLYDMYIYIDYINEILQTMTNSLEIIIIYLHTRILRLKTKFVFVVHG